MENRLGAMLADVRDWLWDHILLVLFGVLTLACLLLAGQYVLTWPVGEALQDAWAQMRHHWQTVLVGAWAVLGGWTFRQPFSRILRNYAKGFYDYCGEHRTFIRGLLVVLVALGEIALLLIFWKPVSGFFNTHSWLNSMQLFLLSAPVAYLLWIYRDANKLEEIENERIGQKQADFHKLEEWLASAKTDENLKVVAVHQLEPYLRLDAGYPAFFQRPCCGLLLSILEEWGKQQRETPKKAAAETDHVSVEVPATIQAIHALVARNLAWVCQLAEHHVLDLSFARLERANLEGAYLKNAHLEGANFEDAYLKEANLEGAILNEANLVLTHLEGARLRGAHLARACLKGAHLNYADLLRTNLKGAFLDNANLKYAYLVGADINDAHLEGAYLVDAILDEADFTGAHGLTVEQFKGTRNLDKARFNANFREELVRAYPHQFPHEQVPATEAEDSGPMFDTP